MNNAAIGTLETAGFWRRAWGSSFIDSFCVSQALGILLYIGYATTRDIVLVSGAMVTILMQFHFVYFHSIWGQSFGRVLLGTRLVSVTGKTVSAKQSLLRYSVDVAMAIIFSVISVISLLSISQEQYADSSFMQRAFLPFSVLSLAWVMAIGFVWQLLNLIVFFSNTERRTIRDYIAGTRVVKVPSFTHYPKLALFLLFILSTVTQQLFMRSLGAQGSQMQLLFFLGSISNIVLLVVLLWYVLRTKACQTLV